MLDLGWSELLVVAVLTVLIFGPKELPTVLRTVTQFASKLRGMARDFQRTIDDVAREAELDKLKDEVKDATDANSMLDPTGTENKIFDRIFDDDEEDDGTPINRPAKPQSTSPVPGFDKATETADTTADQPGEPAAAEAAETAADAEPDVKKASGS